MTETTEKSAESIATKEPPRASAPRGRRSLTPLTREGILHAALRLIDQEGLEALTMRKLAQVVGVDPMSLYRHFENKEALLTGLAEVLWAEVAVPDDAGWEAILRSLAHAVRSVAHAHPHAYILLCQCPTLPTAMLCLFNGALGRLQQAGFERQRAAEALNAVLSYAFGYAMMELAAGPLTQSAEPTESTTPTERPQLPRSASDFARIAQVMRAIPRDAPPQLAEMAYLIADFDLDAQFTLGLDLMLTGLAARADRHTAHMAHMAHDAHPA